MIPQDKYFKDLDFEKVEIDGQTLYRGVDNAFFRLDQREGYIAIEAADTEEEVKKAFFEDAEFYRYSITGSEKETFNLVRDDLKKHYAINAPEPY